MTSINIGEKGCAAPGSGSKRPPARFCFGGGHLALPRLQPPAHCVRHCTRSWLEAPKGAGWKLTPPLPSRRRSAAAAAS